MRLLLNLNKITFLYFLFILSCNDSAIITACSPNQELDSCGNCYYTQNDPSWNNCVDSCEIANGQNICDYENIINDNCDCSGCKEQGDAMFCQECLFSNPCDCDNALYSYFEIDVNPNCTNTNMCDDYDFNENSLNLNIRERCGLLTSINSDYTINSINNIQLEDPCGNIINMIYYDDLNQNNDISNGCDLPINNILILNNGDILYNSSDDIGDFEFSLENHCESLSSSNCQTIAGCTWGNNNSCIQNNINGISGGDAGRQGYNLNINLINNQYYINGLFQNLSVIPHATDYLNTIAIKNNDSVNSIYIEWDNILFSENNYIEIPPSQNFIITHNNWCDGTLGSIIIDNDNLTTYTPSMIEGYYFDGNNFIKFGEVNINLFFQSLEEFSLSQPTECY